MTVRFRLGNMMEKCSVHEKLDNHVSAGRERDGHKQLYISVEFTKYRDTSFRLAWGGETRSGTKKRCSQNLFHTIFSCTNILCTSPALLYVPYVVGQLVIL